MLHLCHPFIDPRAGFFKVGTQKFSKLVPYSFVLSIFLFVAQTTNESEFQVFFGSEYGNMEPVNWLSATMIQ